MVAVAELPAERTKVEGEERNINEDVGRDMEIIPESLSPTFVSTKDTITVSLMATCLVKLEGDT